MGYVLSFICRFFVKIPSFISDSTAVSIFVDIGWLLGPILKPPLGFGKWSKKYIFPRFSSFWNRSRKDTLHWTRTLEKPNGKALMIEANFEKKLFANVEKILCKLRKNTLHWTWTREKPNGKTLVLEANFEEKKYFANVEKILCKCWKNTLQMLEILERNFALNLDTRKAQWRNISVRSKSRIWLQSRKQFWIVKRSFASQSFYL